MTEILVIWAIPGFSDDYFELLAKAPSLRGLVLMLYGCGNAPARKERFVRNMRALVERGVVVVACTQCLRGTVSLEKYAVGKAFQECGVVSAIDMTTEATVTKLAYLLSKNLGPEQARNLMGQDLRGELSNEDTTFAIREQVSGLNGLVSSL